MARPRKTSDEQILERALVLMEERGSDALTFALLSERCGLSPATLVQRFGSKQKLIDAAVAYAWVALEVRTRKFASEQPQTPEGAVALLGRLSEDYGDIDSYADKLHVLREDLRSPEFRARGEAWVAQLAALLDACFTGQPSAPRDLGSLMIAQWQGALLLWAFSPREPLDAFVRAHMLRFLQAFHLAA